MKNKLLLFTIALSVFFNYTKAQIVNASFENWQVDTSDFAGLSPYLLPDTFAYTDPVGWTSTNSVTEMPALGQAAFVTQSGNAYAGQYAVQITTDTVHAQNLGSIILPGFLLNGSFSLSIANLILGENITPTAVKGAGQPFTQRLDSLHGYYNYTPVFNPHTNSNDTCLIWATLRNGNTVIANAIFKSTASTDGYQPFSAAFNYVSCEMPDTLVILIASSIPNIPNLFSGSSNLVSGSVLLVDTLSYDTLPANYEFTPFAYSDTASTLENTPVDIYVKTNDADCSYPLDNTTINIFSQATHGTATVSSNNYIIYTPTINYTGNDTFWYTLSDTALTSAPAEVVVTVSPNAGILSINKIPVNIYPVPVNDELHVQFENPGKTTARVFDITGQLLGTYPLTENNNTIYVSPLASGLYLLQVVNEENELLSASRFIVCK